MNILQTIILAIIQGISELFPISSVAHSVIAPYVFGWKLDPTFLKQNFLEFVVMMHLGTTAALLVYFRKDWAEVIRSIFARGKSKKLLLLLAAGSFPAAVLGLIFEKKITSVFSNVTVAATFLIANGVLLFVGERLRRKGTKTIDDLTWKQAGIIGLFQSLALIPGFSRSGSSMTAGFWMGLTNEESARFSMLLAAPAILGAGIFEVPKMVRVHTPGLLQLSLLGGAVAGVFAFISVFLLMKWFNRKEINTMAPFSVYCAVVGLLVLGTRTLF
ncbi:MAG: undecaprenyl-diphosphate phosphatase [Ethanoligenens sp.]|uniref:undecaprenyl-diphosphate phosphatase n=1 Tax=Ethanoligenens sp. TaxID=2099655 RepID=UPI0039EAAAF7